MQKLNTITALSAEHFLTIIIFGCLGLMPFVPVVESVTSIVFISTLAIAMLFSIYKGIKYNLIDSFSFYLVFYIFFLMVVNGFIALNQGDKAEDFLRALTPFIFLLFYIHLYVNHNHEYRFILSCILFCCLVWMVKIYLLYPIELILVLTGKMGRLTYVSTELLIPFGMIGFVVSLYLLCGFKRFLICLLFFVLIISSGYRGQILLVLFVLLFYIKFWKTMIGFIALPILFILLLLIISLDIKAVDLFLDRLLSGSSGDNVRAAEISFAINEFIKSPLLGQGLGNLIPVSLTRTDNMLQYFEKTHVAYIHNFIAYFLMNTGLVGTLLLFLIFRPFVILLKLNTRYALERKKYHECVLLLTFSIFAFFQVSASFRQVQMMIIISSLLMIANGIVNEHNKK